MSFGFKMQNTFVFFSMFLLPQISASCFRPEKSKTYFLCPIDYTEVGGFELELTPMNEVLIQCEHLQTFNVSQIPKLTIKRINLLQFKFCPLPQSGFNEVLKHFSTDNIVVIDYQYGSFNTVQNYLQNLSKLRFLKLRENKIGNLSDYFFQDVPNLFALELRKNRLTHLGKKVFEKLQFLEWIDLSENDFKKIPPNIFKSQKNLEYLILSHNNLTQLNPDMLNGLSKLQSLDLSFNQLSRITENTFQNSTNLVNISLTMNKLQKIPKNLFTKNKNLQVIKLNHNQGLLLTDYLFSNFSALQNVDLSNCNLKIVPEHIFENSLEIKLIKLKENLIKTVPRKLFQNLINIREIDLSKNKITDIDNIFFGLVKLERLFLQNNEIKSINEDTFFDLMHLKQLNLANNKLEKIHPQAFFNNEYLRSINLAKNFYSGENQILRNAIYLSYVDLSHNLIKEVEQVINIENKPLLEVLDFRYNRITNVTLRTLQGASEVEIFLDFNNISVVNFENVEDLETPYLTTISLGNNPIACDCRNYDLVRYFTSKFSKQIVEMFNIRKENLFCESPKALKGTHLEEVPISDITCNLNETTIISENCSHIWRPFDKSVIIDCTNKSLTTTPRIFVDIVASYDFEELEVHLQFNNLTIANLSGYENVTKLILSHNKLVTICDLPNNLKVFKIDDNLLSSLDVHILEKLNSSSLVELRLSNNPWLCICGTEYFSNFIRQHTKQISDFKKILCSDNTTRLIDLHSKDLCQDFALIVTIILTCILFPTTVLVIFYYRYQTEIKVWLYSKNLCLCWVSEEDLDADKSYDAFISYSHLDEGFVVNNLIPKLEQDSYKLCLHFRDWTPGELISAQIVKSISNSKRTIVVLSSNFLESVWGKVEFKRAHAESMSEGRARLVIVLYGDISFAKLDKDMKSYLKTTTYLQWGDPYFWQKLKYALPHRKNKV